MTFQSFLRKGTTRFPAPTRRLPIRPSRWACCVRYGGEWALPAVNRTIYDLFYELKRGPYENLGSWNLNRFLRENAEFIAFALLAAFIIISYAVSLSVLVKRKTAQLRRALEEREMIEAEAVQSRQHIANLERTGIVGRMSSSSRLRLLSISRAA